jgi:hypothetical protein
MNYAIIIPYYFGWFFNSIDSNELVNKTKNIFDECVKNCDQFKLELINQSG